MRKSKDIIMGKLQKNDMVESKVHNSYYTEQLFAE